MMQHEMGLDALMTVVFGNPGSPWCRLLGMEGLAHYPSLLRCPGLKRGEAARHTHTLSEAGRKAG